MVLTQAVLTGLWPSMHLSSPQYSFGLSALPGLSPAVRPGSITPWHGRIPCARSDGSGLCQGMPANKSKHAQPRVFSQKKQRLVWLCGSPTKGDLSIWQSQIKDREPHKLETWSNQRVSLRDSGCQHPGGQASESWLRKPASYVLPLPLVNSGYLRRYCQGTLPWTSGHPWGTRKICE